MLPPAEMLSQVDMQNNFNIFQRKLQLQVGHLQSNGAMAISYGGSASYSCACSHTVAVGKRYIHRRAL